MDEKKVVDEIHDTKLLIRDLEEQVKEIHAYLEKIETKIDGLNVNLLKLLRRD